MSDEMMPSEASTHLLAYASKRLRALNSRSYRVVSPSTNTSSATLGQTIEFRIPGNQAASFLDNATMYIKFNVANSGSNFNLEGKSGAYAFIKKIDILTRGQTISSVDNYNVLHSCFIDTDTSVQYGNNVGSVLSGMNNTAVGQLIGNGTNADFVLPFVMNCIANSKKYIPLFSRDALVIKIQLDTALNSVKTNGTDTVNDNQITISTPELIYNVVELDATAFAAVSDSVGGKFEIVADDYRHTSATVPNNANQTFVANLGFAFSSLNRVIVAQRNSVRQSANTLCIGNRQRRGLIECNLLLNGESIPSRPIRISDQASEALAELLVADRALLSSDHDSRLNLDNGFAENDRTGIDAANTGHFLVQIDTESMRSNSDDPGIYSGISSIGSVSQLVLKYGNTTNTGGAGDAGGPTILDVYAQYTTLLSLDMNSSQVFIVSN